MEAINTDTQTASGAGSDEADQLAAEYDTLQLGSGSEQPSDWLNTDINPKCNPDYVLDITEPWPESWTGRFEKIVANHVLEHIPHEVPPGVNQHPTLSNHVFPEAARVLQPGGTFEVRVPVGSNATTDITHQSVWEWRTPVFYADEGRHWVPDYGFDLVERDLTVWMIGELQALNRAVTPLARRYANEFWYELPGATGEITAQYRLTTSGGDSR